MNDDPARVLVIEGDPAVRSILCRILNEAGHDVLEADTEFRALELSLGNRINAVIVDVDLAGEDGITAMAGIRYLLPEVPFIVVSGRDREAILGRIEAKGLRSRVWWLGKPFVREELIGMIERALAE